MEMNEENLQALTTYLQQTMSPDIKLRKPAEDFLKSVEGQQGYAMLLLALLGSERPVGNDIKLAAAIAFKNFIKRNWKVVSTVITIILRRFKNWYIPLTQNFHICFYSHD